MGAKVNSGLPSPPLVLVDNYIFTGFRKINGRTPCEDLSPGQEILLAVYTLAGVGARGGFGNGRLSSVKTSELNSKGIAWIPATVDYFSTCG